MERKERLVTRTWKVVSLGSHQKLEDVIPISSYSFTTVLRLLREKGYRRMDRKGNQTEFRDDSVRISVFIDDAEKTITALAHSEVALSKVAADFDLKTYRPL